MKTLLGPRQQFDWKIVTIIVASTLLLTVDWYPAPFTINKVYERTIFYFVIPMLLILLVFRENPRDYGFTFGDWKAGLALTAISIILIAPVLWLVAHGGAMTDYYKNQVGGLPWNTFADLFGWEFFFRGFILFAFYKKFGPDALWLQAVPFALAHLGKPEVETLSTIFGGFVFGWIAYRSRSFVYPFIIHWFVASFTIIVAAGFLG